jgi:aspartate kinase
MKVLKFGGTSVQDSTAIKNVVRIIASRRPSPLLVVTSACAGVTNALLQIADTAAKGDASGALTQLADVRRRHEGIAGELIAAGHLKRFDAQLEKECNDLGKTIRQISAAGKVSPQRSDAVVSYGELWASRLLFLALHEGGVVVELVDSRDLLITDTEFTRATPIFDKTNSRVRKILIPRLKRSVVVTQGFVGQSLSGRTTTIGRGGSDYSASIFGSALGASEIEIWTDTDGILSADPRIVPAAQSLTEISTEEATELAHFGAKVVHPSTLAPATDAKIPVRILNSFKPYAPGTLIRPDGEAATSKHVGVKSITGKKGVCTVAIRKDKRMNKFHFLQHVFHVLENHKEAVEFISSSETGVLVLTNDEEDHQPFLDELRHHDGVEIREELAIVCVVGTFAAGERSMVAQLHDILQQEDVPIYLSYNGVSSRSVAVVIDGERFEEVVTLLHDQLVNESAARISLGKRALRLIVQARPA